MSIIVIRGGKMSQINSTKQMNGEKIPGDLSTWDYFGTSPNDILTLNYDVLSQRSTTLFHTHGPISGGINKLTNYAVGPGLLFRSQPDWEILEMTKDAAKKWSMKFQKLVHYAFKLLNFYEKQSIIFKTSLIMGDSLLFFDRFSPSSGMPFDLIETGGDQIKFDASETDKITLGIIHDDLLRRKGIVKIDNKKVMFTDQNGDQNVIQFYLKQMARQLRGFPLAYKIISAAKNNDRWWDATLARAVVESMLLGHSEEETNDTYTQAMRLAEDIKSESGASVPIGTLSTDGNIANAAPGSLLSYRKGGGFKFSDLKTPSNNFDKLQNAYIDIVGMAIDVPPEVLMSKYSTSYTAHKGALNDFVKSYMQKRIIFANNLIKPIIRELAKWFFMENMIEMPHPDFFKNPIIQEAALSGNWLGPVPGHINPLQEANAKAVEVENAFKLRSDAAAEYGNEFDNMIEEWTQEEKAWGGKSSDQKAAIIEKQNTNIYDNADDNADDTNDDLNGDDK